MTEERSAAALAAISAGFDQYYKPTPDNEAARNLAAVLATVDEPLPCTQNPRLWSSRSYAAREKQLNLCGSCPIRDECPSAFVTINSNDREWVDGKRRIFSPFRSG